MAELNATTAADLAEMSLPDLKALQKKVSKAIETFEDRQKKAALAELEAKAKELGFSLADLMGQTAKGAKAKGLPKYADPSDPSKTWTGKGRRPDWFIAALEAGKAPEELAL
ncbi:MAG: H-NS family nucleoid-associated regulatory protein [Thalassovita sp.]